MAIVLSDDGTMDTVLRCTECGEEFRFNYDPEPPFTDDAERDADGDYASWIDACIEEVASEHECAFHPERDEEETE